jgi:outer membrane biosynthesis protein TonB
MKFHPRIWAGTALSLLMASSQSGAMSIGNEFAASPNLTTTQGMLVQADCLEGETAEACALRLRPGAPAEQVPAPVPETAPVPEAPVTPSPEAPPADQPAPEAPAAEPAPVPSDQPPAEQPAAEPPVPETPATEPVQPAGDQSQSGEKPADPNAAPVLDSQKEAPATEGSSQPGQAGDKPAPPKARSRQKSNQLPSKRALVSSERPTKICAAANGQKASMSCVRLATASSSRSIIR